MRNGKKPVIHMPDDPRQLTRITENTLTGSEQKILEIIRKYPGVIVAELATHLNLCAPTVGTPVQRLVKRGLVVRKKIMVIDATHVRHEALGLYLSKKGNRFKATR